MHVWILIHQMVIHHHSVIHIHRHCLLVLPNPLMRLATCAPWPR